MHSEKWLWTNCEQRPPWVGLFHLSRHCHVAAVYLLLGTQESVVNSLSFIGTKNPHSWVVPAWAFPFWPSWLPASIWVPVLRVFICKLQFWPTIHPSCLLRVWVCRAETFRLCQEQPFHRWLSEPQQNIRIRMRACFLLHPYQAQFPSLLNWR